MEKKIFKTVRALSGQTQKDFSDQLGLTVVHVSNMERGKTKLPQYMMDLLKSRYPKEYALVIDYLGVADEYL